MEEGWCVELAETMQMHADTGNQHEFHSTLKAAYGPTFRAPFPVRSRDGKTLITDKVGTLKRWAECFAGLLNKGNNFDPTLLEEIPDAPTFWEMDDPPTRLEVQNAIAGLKINQAVGPDSLPAEVINMVARRCWNVCVGCFMRSGTQVVLLNSGRMPMLSASIRRKVTGPCAPAETAEASPFCPQQVRISLASCWCACCNVLLIMCCRSPSAGSYVKGAQWIWCL